MNRLPTKQIYLLTIIIVGIIALSVYSTYALFTFENETSDIVSIHIPKSLTISESIYEYQQIKVAPNTIATTDVDIYNSFDYEVCYSVWYKIIGGTDIQNKVQLFELTPDNLQTSGVLSIITNQRVTLVIINDNDTEIKINLGTISAPKDDNGSCSLNLASDKNVISVSYEHLDILTTKILENQEISSETEEGYLTYKNQKEVLTYKNSDTIYAANEFTYSEELFTLTNAKPITITELIEQNRLQDNDIYMCLDDTKCSILYKFNTSNIETLESSGSVITYNITTYDKLIGYSSGINGLRQINDTDYIYYGDNPNNFIYYNCGNNDDLTTCELWRIVGFFYDTKTNKYNTKIVRNDSIGQYQFDYKIVENENNSSNVWNTSTLNEYLNNKYKLINSYEIYLSNHTQQVERITDLEADVKNIQIQDEYNDTQINLLNLSDYLYTSSCQKNKITEYTDECLTNNWLNNIEIPTEWTMTAKELVEPVVEDTIEDLEQSEITDDTDDITEETENNETSETDDNTDVTENPTEEPEDTYIINYIYSIGKEIVEANVNDTLDVRPVVFLKPRMILLEGNGSLESPYVIK